MAAETLAPSGIDQQRAKHGISGNRHDYDMTTPGQFVEPSSEIGISRGYLARLGKKVALTKSSRTWIEGQA